MLPEPVGNESRDDFRGPEFRSRRVQKQQKDATDRRKGEKAFLNEQKSYLFHFIYKQSETFQKAFCLRRHSSKEI